MTGRYVNQLERMDRPNNFIWAYTSTIFEDDFSLRFNFPRPVYNLVQAIFEATRDVVIARRRLQNINISWEDQI